MRDSTQVLVIVLAALVVYLLLREKKEKKEEVKVVEVRKEYVPRHYAHPQFVSLAGPYAGLRSPRLRGMRHYPWW